MNFFGHAVLALRRRAEPRWVLGAMAPDFASMAGLRLRRRRDADADAPPEAGAEVDPLLDGGIAFHHRTDDAFHGAPRFVALMKRARIDLEGRGLSAGPCLAISHVGVELLLDGRLVARDGVPEAYRAAVAGAADAADALRFWGEAPVASRQRWRDACMRIAAAPLPEGYRDPAFVAERLIRILASRPRLAVEPGGEPAVFAWAEAAVDVVDAEVDPLLAEVEARLAQG